MAATEPMHRPVISLPQLETVHSLPQAASPTDEADAWRSAVRRLLRRQHADLTDLVEELLQSRMIKDALPRRGDDDDPTISPLEPSTWRNGAVIPRGDVWPLSPLFPKSDVHGAQESVQDEEEEREGQSEDDYATESQLVHVLGDLTTEPFRHGFKHPESRRSSLASSRSSLILLRC